MDVIASSIIAAGYDPNPGFTGVLMGPPEPVKILRVRRWGLGSIRQVVSEILAAYKGRSRSIEIKSGDPLDPIRLCRKCTIIMLDEAGSDISQLGDSICGDTAFLLGGHTGFPGELYEDLRRASHALVSLGPISLQTYQAILYTAWRRATLCGPSSRRE